VVSIRRLDQQAGDQSEPVPDDQSLIDVRQRQCEDDDLIAQIGHDMAVEAEIRLLLTGAKTSDTMKKSQ